MPDESPRKQTAAVKDLTIGLGMLSVVGNLYTVVDSSGEAKEKTNYACPTCVSGVAQEYKCKEKGHGPFPQGELRKGKMVDDKFVIVDTEAIESAKESVLPKGELNLQVHRKADVDDATVPNGNVYVFTPKGPITENSFYTVLVSLLKKRTDIVLIAKVNMRKADHLVEVRVDLNDQLVVQEVVWPEDMRHFAPVVCPPLSAKNMKIAEMLIDANIEDFVPSQYNKESRDRIAAVIQEATDGKAAQKPTKAQEKKKVNDDLETILEAALAASLQKKAS